MGNIRKLASSNGGSNPAAEVWFANLEIPEDEFRQLAEFLDPDEHARAARFLRPHLARRFVAARGTLRLLLGQALAIPPQAVRFRFGTYGKPSLAEECAASGLAFNLSHSEDGALIALAWGREVGVDLERLRPGIEIESVAQRFFAPAEYEWILSYGPQDRLEPFYLCWTAKEAFLKAHGAGLTFPLEKFSVLPEADSGALKLTVYEDAFETARWTIERVPVASGWTGALAVATS
jgi:4'-phosphopantetheinyl transferase